MKIRFYGSLLFVPFQKRDFRKSAEIFKLTENKKDVIFGSKINFSVKIWNFFSFPYIISRFVKRAAGHQMKYPCFIMYPPTVDSKYKSKTVHMTYTSRKLFE